MRGSHTKRWLATPTTKYAIITSVTAPPAANVTAMPLRTHARHSRHSRPPRPPRHSHHSRPPRHSRRTHHSRQLEPAPLLQQSLAPYTSGRLPHTPHTSPHANRHVIYARTTRYFNSI